jgi:hypothetical protein
VQGTEVLLGFIQKAYACVRRTGYMNISGMALEELPMEVMELGNLRHLQVSDPALPPHPADAASVCIRGLQNAECRMQNAECRMQNAECRMQNAECRMQNAECRMQNAVLTCLSTEPGCRRVTTTSSTSRRRSPR